VAIFVDSAHIDDLTTAAALGFVRGFTTNPTLMARETGDALAHFRHLLAAFPEGPAFYQPTGASEAALRDEALAAASLAPDRVVIKLGATEVGAATAGRLTAQGVRCALTAAYSPAQALVAHESGCAWVIPYVDRAIRQRLDGLGLVASFAAVLATTGDTTRVLAASLKTPAQVSDAVLHGAHDVTAPLAVLRSLPVHASSEAAMREFASAWKAKAAERVPDSSAG